MIVLDASVVVAWLLGLPQADAVAHRLATERSLHAPHLLMIEVAQVVRRFERRGEISAQSGAAALTDLADLDVALYPHEPFLSHVWAARANLTAYDAVYVALAVGLDAPLVTLDARMAAAPDLGAQVELLA